MEEAKLLSLTLPGGFDVADPLKGSEFLPGRAAPQTLGDVVSIAIFIAIVIASVILTLYLIIGALRLIFSAGDPRNIEGARGMIITAIVGFIIVFVAFWLLKVIETIVGGGITSFVSPAFAQAEPGDIGEAFKIGGRPAGKLFPKLEFFGQAFAPKIVSLLFIVGGIAATFMILIGGLRYIFSGGDEKAVAGARGQITLAVVGLVVLFATFLILLVIQNLTRFPILG